MRDGHIVSIVDDDPAVRQAIGGLLRSAGLPVAMFGSADEFLRSPDRWATRCLILDLRMPGMDGLMLQHELRSTGHRFPVIIVTAHGDPEVRARALDAGAEAFLPKPVDGDVLVAVVESATMEP
jgi:FixJ family two-component response regulator